MKVGYKRYATIEDRYKAYIEGCKLPHSSKTILWEWANERRANKFKDVNNLGLLGTIISIGKAIDKDLAQITRLDLMNFKQS